jgi:hypothetical protein
LDKKDRDLELRVDKNSKIKKTNYSFPPPSSPMAG